jgi:hypothetical protein
MDGVFSDVERVNSVLFEQFRGEKILSGGEFRVEDGQAGGQVVEGHAIVAGQEKHVFEAPEWFVTVFVH